MGRRTVQGHLVDLDEVGSGVPVLMLHGFPLDRRSLARALGPVFDARPGYRRLHVDLPGFGLSPGADEIEGSGDMVDFVLAYIDEVIGDEPLLVVGESWGAYLARGVIARRAGQVAGAALICPVIVAPHAERDVPEHEPLDAPADLLDSGLAVGAAGSAHRTDPDVAAFLELAVSTSHHAFDHWRSAIQPALDAADAAASARIEANYAFDHDVDRVGPPFDRPSLIVLGRQDSVVGYRDALRLVDRYPRSTFAILDVAGHNLLGERPGVIAALIDDWLDRVERF